MSENFGFSPVTNSVSFSGNYSVLNKWTNSVNLYDQYKVLPGVRMAPLGLAHNTSGSVYEAKTIGPFKFG